MKAIKTIAVFVTTVMIGAAMTGCSGTDTTITVISREDGSGTRSAFSELLGIVADGVDNTVDTAEISNSTAVVIQSVAGNESSIGYISLGSLGDEVRAVSVDGIEATVENVSNGTYKVSRPFNIATRSDISDLAADFVTFILSADGQAIVDSNGYITAYDNESYTPSGLTGTIVVAGSTSVAPLIEVLADEYKALNSGVIIEIQQTGSSAGIISTIEGACDIGMASREVKDSEIAEGLIPTVIALDGIAVIVNNNNPVLNLTSEQIKSIYTGEITDWNEVK